MIFLNVCIQNLLRLSLGSGGPGMSPEALQSHSLPSSVSDALEAMVGGGLDDLTLEDIDPSSLAEEQQQQQSEVYTLWYIQIYYNTVTVRAYWMSWPN